MLRLSPPGRSLLKRAALSLFVVVLVAIGAGSRAALTTAVDAPTITKAVTTGITNPDATNGYFTITIHIPTVDTPKIVHVVDAGASLLGSTPNTGACTQESTGWRCRVDAPDLVLRMSLPLSLASNAPQFCTAGTLTNMASMNDGDAVNPLATSNTAELTVPASPDDTCGPATRQLQICKTVVNNGDLNTDSAIFGGTVVGTTTNATWTTTTAVAEGDAITCDTKTVGASESVTVTESTPGGWTNASGFPQFFLGTGDCSGSQTALGTGAVVGTGSNKITICNKKVAAPTTRDIQVCKVVVDNGDGTTDSATFGGTVVGTTTPSATWTTTTAVAEGDAAKCDTKTVGAESVTVAETTPSGWTDASGYPKYFLNTAACSPTNAALGTGATVGTSDTKITICNRAAVHTRSVQVCKLVLDNAALPAAEGGDFGGALSPSAGTGGNWSILNQKEGDTVSCASSIVIVDNATFTLTETGVPSGWTNATGFPQYVTDTATCSATGTDSALLANTTFAATVVKVTICNTQNPTTRQVTVCKVVLSNGADPAGEGGAFGGKVIASGVEHTWSVTGAVEGGEMKCSDPVTIPIDAGFDVTETSFPAGWTSANGYPIFLSGNSGCISDQRADQVTDFGSTVDTVTVCNRKTPPPPTRTVTICKAVLSNGDGVTDGGDFGGSLTPSTGTGGTWAVTGVDESGSKCGDAITIAAAATFTLSESNLPASWTNESGYPKYVTGDDTCTADANALSGKTFVATVTKVTVCNRRVQHTRSVTICKAVLNNGDGTVDGGTFGGSLTPSAGSGGNWSTASVNEGESKCSDAAITLIANATFTLSEGTLPNAWTNESGYPKYVTGEATCSTTAEALSGKPFESSVTKVTVCNRRTQHTRTVTICKAVLQNNDTIVDSGDFGGTLTPSAGTPAAWATTGVSEGGTKCADALTVVDNATFTLSEGSLPDGWTNAGGFPKYATGDATCSDQSPGLDAQVTFAATVTKVTVCNKKTPATGTIRITKIDLTSGHATWNFSVSGPTVIADQSVLGGNTTGASKEVTGLVLNASVYTVTELGALGANLTTECPADNTNPNLVKVTQTSGVGGIALTTAGQVAEFTFVNEPCDVAGSLVVTKVRDNNGNHIQDGLDTTITWTVKITGPTYPAGQLFTVNGTRVFTALAVGAYTIEETDGAPDYKTVGVVTSDAGFSASGTATTTLTNGDTDTITFYNQPRVSVRVTKTESRLGQQSAGSGWTFTLSGCGVTSQQATTGASGVVTFSDLPPAIGCTYTVTEQARNGWTAFPALAQTANPSLPGQTADVAFTNVFNIPVSPPPGGPPTGNPLPPIVPPPGVVLLPSTPPAATPTAATPPSTPTPTVKPAPSVVLSDAPTTPAKSVGPKPPTAGSGTKDGGALSPWLVLPIVLMAGAGLIIFGRRRNGTR